MMYDKTSSPNDVLSLILKREAVLSTPSYKLALISSSAHAATWRRPMVAQKSRTPDGLVLEKP